MNDDKSKLYCRTDNSGHQAKYLLSLAGIAGFFGVTTILILAIRPVQAGIVQSAVELTETKHKEGCSGIETSRSIKRAGQTAFKHWIDRCGNRAEVRTRRTKIGETYWYGWSLFIPTNWQDSDPGFDIVNQFSTWPSHNGRFPKSGCGAVGTTISRQANKGLVLNLQRQGDDVDVLCTEQVLAKISEIKGQWTDFVMHVKWTGNNDGFLKLWMKTDNGKYVQKINYQGATFWNDEGEGPYFKMGLYKGDPNFKGPAPRVVYTDEYRMGDANSSFEQVAPAGDTGTTDTSTTDTNNQDTSTTDPSTTDTSTTDTSTRDTDNQDTDNQNTNTIDTDNQDINNRDSSTTDPDNQDTNNRDTSTTDTDDQDPSTTDTNTRDTDDQDPSTTDTNTRDTDNQDRSTTDTSTTDTSTRDTDNQDPSTTDTSTTDTSTTDTSTRDTDNQDTDNQNTNTTDTDNQNINNRDSSTTDPDNQDTNN